MLAIERKNEILARLRSEQRVLVSELSAQYNVTEETIRRDLEKLEQEGYATKTYGGAILAESTKTDLSHSIRAKTNVEAKRKIAKTVAELVENGDHLMMDDSSTSLFVARELKKKKNLTIITNSIEIIIELANVESFSVLSTGGWLKENSLALVGHQAEQTIRSFHVDKAIISCKGIDTAHSITDSSEVHTLTKHAMISSARKTILAADSSKFGKVAFVQIAPLSALDTIVTEKAPDEAFQTLCRRLDIDCLYS